MPNDDPNQLDSQQSYPPNKPYDFDIQGVLKRATQLSRTNNWLVAQALVVIIAISMAIYVIYMRFYGVESFSIILENPQTFTKAQQATIELTLTIILAPLWTGAAMLSVWTNRGQKAQLTYIFYFYKLIPMLAIGAAIVSLLTTFGFIMFILPGFYIFTATTFTLNLIADKQMTALSAIILSVKTVNKHLLKFLQLYGLMLLISAALLFISFGIAFLWIGPFYLNVKAVLYQDLFCNEQDTKFNQQGNDQSGVFNA